MTEKMGYIQIDQCKYGNQGQSLFIYKQNISMKKDLIAQYFSKFDVCTHLNNATNIISNMVKQMRSSVTNMSVLFPIIMQNQQIFTDFQVLHEYIDLCKSLKIDTQIQMSVVRQNILYDICTQELMDDISIEVQKGRIIDYVFDVSGQLISVPYAQSLKPNSVEDFEKIKLFIKKIPAIFKDQLVSLVQLSLRFENSSLHFYMPAIRDSQILKSYFQKQISFNIEQVAQNFDIFDYNQLEFLFIASLIQQHKLYFAQEPKQLSEIDEYKESLSQTKEEKETRQIFKDFFMKNSFYSYCAFSDLSIVCKVLYQAFVSRLRPVLTILSLQELPETHLLCAGVSIAIGCATGKCLKQKIDPLSQIRIAQHTFLIMNILGMEAEAHTDKQVQTNQSYLQDLQQEKLEKEKREQERVAAEQLQFQRKQQQQQQQQLEETEKKKLDEINALRRIQEIARQQAEQSQQKQQQVVEEVSIQVQVAKRQPSEVDKEKVDLELKYQIQQKQMELRLLDAQLNDIPSKKTIYTQLKQSNIRLASLLEQQKQKNDAIICKLQAYQRKLKQLNDDIVSGRKAERRILEEIEERDSKKDW